MLSIFEKTKMSFRFVMTELERPLISLLLVDEHRNLDCVRYDKCLDLAIKKNWRSFSCCRCSVFKAHLEERKERKKIKEEMKSSFLGGGYYEEGFI